MLSTSWTTPAGFVGLGSADVRPYGCAALRPDLGGIGVPVQGTRVPAAALRHRGTGLPTTGMPAAKQLVSTPQFVQFQNDGTTLGSHPSRRPLS
jgi:hypothetical protein